MLAQKRFGRKLVKDDILKVLQSMEIAAVASRPNVAQYPGQEVRSVCLGLSARRGTLTLPTYAASGIFELLTRWLRSDPQWHDFLFSSITINKNHDAALHRYSGNVGPSVIVTAGSYSGGDLRVFPDDDRISHPSCFRLEDGELLHTDDFVLFDG